MTPEGPDPLTPAGTMGRPALPVTELDARAWGALRWRQDHLPLGAIRRRGDRAALENMERRAAWRIAAGLGLDDDQRYSLLRQHGAEVRRRVTEASPDLAAPARPGVIGGSGRRAGFYRPSPLTGWLTWLGNRRAGARDGWFRLRTRGYYSGAPEL